MSGGSSIDPAEVFNDGDTCPACGKLGVLRVNGSSVRCEGDGCSESSILRAGNLLVEPDPPDDEAAKPGAVVTSLADVQPEPVRWLWPGRIPLGKLTLIAGDPGLGKSFMTLDIASRTSTGNGWPDRPNEPGEPGGVVLLNAEDDLPDTIRPRLDAAGADVNRVKAIEAVRDLDEKGERSRRTLDLSRDLRYLQAVIEQTPDCRLIIVDPISAYCGKVDSHNNTEVRGMLAPLAELASKHSVAVVAVTHLRKGEGKAVYRAMGSLAYAAASRAAWAVVPDKDDEDRRLLVPAKMNLAKGRSGLAYRLRETMGGVPQVAWEAEPVEMSADEALEAAEGRGGNQRGNQQDEAAEWLQEVLREGPRSAPDVHEMAKQAGHAWGTVKRAKEKAGVKAEQVREDGRIVGWQWVLVSAPDPEDRAGGGETLEHLAPLESLADDLEAQEDQEAQGAQPDTAGIFDGAEADQWTEWEG